MKFATYQDLIDNPQDYTDASNAAFLQRNHKGTDEERYASMLAQAVEAIDAAR